MGSKHLSKYFQKYHNYFFLATVVSLLYACSTTKKVPEGEYLLVKNNFEYEDGKLFDDELPSYVKQKPNKKQLFVFPVGLWMYNLSNAKYDSILTEYFTYPGNMRNQKLRDSLYIKYGHPEYVGKSLGLDRFFHNIGQAPVILDQGRTEESSTSLKKRLIYRGYWDAEVTHSHELDSAAKKAEANYFITHKDPTMISDYYYDIPDPQIKAIYEQDLNKTLIRSEQVLDQTVLEDEVARINTLMQERGYYKFNSSNQEIYFIADTLESRKNVPLTLNIHKDSVDTPYKVATIGNIDVAVVENVRDFPTQTTKDSLRGVRFHKIDDQYKTNALWRAIILRPGERYDQENLDLTKRNLIAMNNFSILKARDSLRRGGLTSPNDSIVDVTYLLKPLPKFERKYSLDLSYSQLLSLGISPAANLTVRNLFGGAQNLNTSISGISGFVQSTKDIDKRVFAYELSFQTKLSFPRLLLPFQYYQIIPKRYSPNSSIILGASYQQNIGMDRVNFNTGLNYNANVNDVVSHNLSIFNTQLSLTRNKEKYYDFFRYDREVRNEIFGLYSPSLLSDVENGLISSDEVSAMILQDPSFQNSLNPEQMDTYNEFLQSLINKDRQTQNVLISSLLYNFVYNEIGKKEFKNPFYFNGKVELAGNLLNLVGSQTSSTGVTTGDEKTVFNIPFSQFAKFDFDVRKYFEFGKQTLALRQFVGIGIPYGNSSSMPFVRSYFNGGSNDIRAWTAFGGLGPADSQLDERIRTYMMDNVKLTTSIEYRIPFNETYEAAIFTDAGNIWSLKDNGLDDEFRFNKFMSQMGVGSGFGLRMNIAYITLRIDLAYKIHDPNKPDGERWRFSKIQPLKPTLNIAFGYPF